MKNYIEGELLKHQLLTALLKIREGALQATTALQKHPEAINSDRGEIIRNLYKSIEREIGAQCHSLDKNGSANV